MKRIAMAVLIGLLFCSSTILAEARIGDNSYFRHDTEIKRIDNNTQELYIKIINTTNKPINNVILMIHTKDTNRNMYEQGFLFLGQMMPNVRKSYVMSIDTPYKFDDYYISPRVLQNDDFQLKEGVVYPVDHFNQYIEKEINDIVEDRGVGIFQGTLTNTSSIPMKRLHFYLGYLDAQDNQLETIFLQWGKLDPGETRPYRFNRVIPNYFRSVRWSFFPIEPGYGAAE